MGILRISARPPVPRRLKSIGIPRGGVVQAGGGVGARATRRLCFVRGTMPVRYSCFNLPHESHWIHLNRIRFIRIRYSGSKTVRMEPDEFIGIGSFHRIFYGVTIVTLEANERMEFASTEDNLSQAGVRLDSPYPAASLLVRFRLGPASPAAIFQCRRRASSDTWQGNTWRKEDELSFAIWSTGGASQWKGVVPWPSQ